MIYTSVPQLKNALVDIQLLLVDVVDFRLDSRRRLFASLNIFV